MFYVEFNFADSWHRLPVEFGSRDDAHWGLARWRQQHELPEEQSRFFRVVEA
jgi:hypothetical protein